MPAFWTGPGGLPDEPPDSGDCDGDCAGCDSNGSDCENRGSECRDDENCKGCTARGWCSEAINDDEEDEECT